ncbi:MULTISPECIES: helix-turn-helix domain-containing protein [Proteus]|mgnify:CR=1 FL=1|jgi:AraC family transcriptional activator of mar-sox-rob regulon/AraC family transposon Tn10 TetD transcriptional regulator|uniref:AraC family transcriptional regulator n=1 Tax=Proteus vulgaris TaxID=585 RepID=A0A379FE81_PROVU|nr:MULTISPECIES: helix-turn-helix domain-containing protein [Proteus]NBN60767.1 helix-turn-helix domain-containing protein [Proteus sp. G2639]RNT29060.1 helix-turn-helix domain-containing protein [Proteus mirabilis]AYY80725.1 helix-turn-helix domain-containing protein [Proteus vulgaris]KGA59611.1 helix-turn-helix domain protein [Proteus vulgaris]MBG5969595.1 helix-turn-helix domain-containing protein [Proteus vulgaris]
MSSPHNGFAPANTLSTFNIEIIKELLLWIEVNLEKPLLLDDVAIKSGYTKWHLQRVFKQATGLTLASYIRGRRLTKAATELRLTKLPILTVALRYQFDSQQSFTRRFKATFGVTPTEYRKLDNLCGDNFQPPINFDVTDLPIPNIMELPESYVYGMQYQYFCSIEDIGKLHEDIRHQFWNDFLLYTDKNFTESTVLISYQPNTLRKNKIQIDYEIGLNSLDHFTKTSGFRKKRIEPGRYVRFQFKGTLDEYKQFAMKIYFYTLPALGLCRRLGADIEKYVSIETDVDLMELPKTLEIDYFVPIH